MLYFMLKIYAASPPVDCVKFVFKCNWHEVIISKSIDMI